jgi:hypothetical protein
MLIAAEGGRRAMLVELSFIEQRHHTVMGVVPGAAVTLMARWCGVPSQAVLGRNSGFS